MYTKNTRKHNIPIGVLPSKYTSSQGQTHAQFVLDFTEIVMMTSVARNVCFKSMKNSIVMKNQIIEDNLTNVPRIERWNNYCCKSRETEKSKNVMGKENRIENVYYLLKIFMYNLLCFMFQKYRKEHCISHQFLFQEANNILQTYVHSVSFTKIWFLNGVRKTFFFLIYIAGSFETVERHGLTKILLIEKVEGNYCKEFHRKTKKQD